MMQPDPDRVGKERTAEKRERAKPKRERLHFFQTVLEEDPIDIRGTQVHDEAERCADAGIDVQRLARG